MTQNEFSVCKAEEGGDAVASLTDDNEAGGNLDKRNIWLIGVGHTSLKFCFSFIFQIPFQASYNVL